MKTGVAVLLLLCWMSGTSHAKKPKPSPDAAAVPIFVEMRGPGSGEMASALVEAGYRVVVDTSSAAVIVRVSASRARKQIPFTGFVVTEVDLFASFIGVADSTVLFQWDERFNSSTGSISTKAVEKIVDKLTVEARLDEYAQVVKRREQERLQREAAQRQAAEAARKSEEAIRLEAERTLHEGDETLWASSNVDACRAPLTMEACDGVKKYLSGGALGTHRDEATAALHEAKPKLAALADEAAWETVDAAKCRHVTSAHDCDLVAAYLTNQPSGAHTEEATALLNNPKLAALKNREGAAEQHRQQVAARAQEREAGESARRQETLLRAADHAVAKSVTNLRGDARITACGPAVVSSLFDAEVRYDNSALGNACRAAKRAESAECNASARCRCVRRCDQIGSRGVARSQFAVDRINDARSACEAQCEGMSQ